MPDRINREIFVAMAKALDFIDPGEGNDEKEKNTMMGKKLPW